MNKKIGSLEAYLDSLASVCRHEAPTEQEKQQTLREHAARFQRRRCALSPPPAQTLPQTCQVRTLPLPGFGERE